MCCDIVQNPARIGDLHATMLHSMGLNHKQLSGKSQRLTAVEPAKVIEGVVA